MSGGYFMPRLEIDKERFAEFLDQFIGDTPYQLSLINKLINQLPSQVAEGLIEDLFYSRVYKGNIYKLQHVVFKDDIHFFPSYENMMMFLEDINKTLCEYNTDSLKNLDKKTVLKRMNDKLPLCGYLITMEEIEHEEPTKTIISRFDQFR